MALLLRHLPQSEAAELLTPGGQRRRPGGRVAPADRQGAARKSGEDELA
ncbi:hypothetical protein [Nonomuraea dietziae]